MRSLVSVDVPFTSALPLRWLRLPLLILTLGLSCVCIAVGAQALDRSRKLEIALNTKAQQTGTMIIFDMNDIKNTVIVLTTVASLLAITSLVFSFSLSYDWIRHLSHPRSTKGQEKVDPSDQLPLQRPPFSTRTLGLQSVTLSFLSVWIFAVLIPSTLFTRTRSAHVTIQVLDAPDLSFVFRSMYWDYGFLRCVAAAPWFSLIFSLPASIVTWIAWKWDASTVGRSI